MMNMQATAYEGYFSNGRFYVSGKAMQIPEKQRVVVTVFANEPTKSLTNKKRMAAQDFLQAMQELRDAGLSTEDNDAIDELQSGKYKPQFEERL